MYYVNMSSSSSSCNSNIDSIVPFSMRIEFIFC